MGLQAGTLCLRSKPNGLICDGIRPSNQAANPPQRKTVNLQPLDVFQSNVHDRAISY